MWSWFTFFLILHILGALVAFGPTFAFGLIAAKAQKEPQYGLFATEVISTITKRMTEPVAVLVPLFGTGLIYTAPGNINLWKSEWLLISIVLYIIAFSFSLFVQSPTAGRMIAALRAMPPGPPPPGAAPPPEIAALGKRLQVGGIFLVSLVVVILVLMIWRPGNCQGIC
jgi:uncharacterized membrane protein